MKNVRPTKPFAKKSLGQNFLVDDRYVEQIVSALDLNSTDTVIEIGPGRGALTQHLIERAGQVIAIELDRELAPLLRDQFRDSENFRVVEADALEADFQTLSSPPYEGGVDATLGGRGGSLVSIPDSAVGTPHLKLVANLPYYISTAILQRLIEQRSAFSQMVLMFQKEVVDRITAKPGDSERGFLTVLVEAFLHAEKLFDVPPTAFHPVPKVWSSVVRLTPKDTLIDDEEAFRKLVSTAFTHKRKTILNNLKSFSPTAAELLASAGIDPSRRAETLSLDEWTNLSEAAI